MTKRILVVLTSHEKYPDMARATGIWLGEAVHFVKKMEEAGFEVDYASPQGGYVPIDPHSLAMAEPEDWQWYGRRDFMDKLGTTLKLSEVNGADYDAIYFVGGHGVLWDFPDDADLQRLSREIWEKGGVVSSVCHGAVGLLNIRLSDGSLLIAGKRLTGFSDAEEKLAELDSHVPFLTETELKARGARYEKATEPWLPFAVADGKLVTGQNPASGGKVGELVVEALKG
jgi:putative intracellular protease/amidase